MNMSISASNEEEYRASYEIEFDIGNAKNRIRTKSNVIFGTPIIHKSGEYELSLLFEPEGIDEFILIVSLKSIASFPSSTALPLSASFTGQTGGPLLEFSHESDNIKISGVLRLFSGPK